MPPELSQPSPTDIIPVRPIFYKNDVDLDNRCRDLFNDFVSDLVKLAGRANSDYIPVTAVREVREAAFQAIAQRLRGFGQPARLAVSVLSDLVSQGWRIHDADENTLFLMRPGRGEDRDADKERVRRALRLTRDEQLSEPSVRAFVRSMETRRFGPRGWTSIYSLMRDGADLVQRLAKAAQAPIGAQRAAVLKGVIDPYLQFVNEDARCEWTGLRLLDIWRYFRYTWLTPARSTPGRTMMILLRDAAAPCHPVVGIAALSSSIVQQSERDRIIGWTRDRVLAELEQNPSDYLAGWLLRSLEMALEDVYHADLVAEQDVESPTPELLENLNRVGLAARQMHQTHARSIAYRQNQSEVKWDEIVDSHLFRSKRALTLADLLSIRLTFRAAGLTRPTRECLKMALSEGGTVFRSAVARLVRQIKASRVGINMMDISVAGAVAPYNELLGGKLVSLLLASPEVRVAYAERYGQMASVIASGMKGEPVHRRPDLVLLCTTGLFAGGSSQYNRVRLPAELLGGTGEIRYQKLEQETEFATFHISQATMQEMRVYSEMMFQGSSVNSIFGEGVNPKMRKLREGLARIGFPPEEILKAGSPRAVYLIPLAHNYREVLLGRADTPDYILPTDNPVEVTSAIADFWRARWLSGRIEQPRVLDAVSRHTHLYPTIHGASVTLPDLEEEQTSFDDLLFEMEGDE